MLKKNSILIYAVCFASIFATCLIFQSCKRNRKQNTAMVKDYIIKGSCGENAKYKLYKNGMLEIYGDGAIADYGYDEEKQRNNTPWAKYNDKIGALKLEGISSIGSYTFGDLKNVKDIVIPSSVKSIRKSAFSGMEQLETITFQGNLDYIGEYALSSCKSLRCIKFEGEVKILDRACFQNNESLEKLVVPTGVSVLPNSMCNVCENLKIIIIPNTVKRIELAFFDCPKLEKVELPESLEYINMGAFTNDVSLNEIIIPKNVTCIECLGTSPELERKITILSEKMPFISCAFSKYTSNVNFNIFVPSKLLNEYRENEKFEAISNRIYPIENNTSIGNYYDRPIDNSDMETFDMPNSSTNISNRHACRTCRNTGNCPLCEGTGKTHTKRVYNYSLDCYDLEYETCRKCHGSRKCTACSGDGWLNQGVDY